MMSLRWIMLRYIQHALSWVSCLMENGSLVNSSILHLSFRLCILNRNVFGNIIVILFPPWIGGYYRTRHWIHRSLFGLGFGARVVLARMRAGASQLLRGLWFGIWDDRWTCGVFGYRVLSIYENRSEVGFGIVGWSIYLRWRHGRGLHATCWSICWLVMLQLMDRLFVGWQSNYCTHVNNNGTCVWWIVFLHYILLCQGFCDTMLPDIHWLVMWLQDRLLVHEVVVVWIDFFLRCYLGSLEGGSVLWCKVCRLS